jgi:hypothetical protein
MAVSRYRLSFRLWHPSMDPRDITATVGMHPVRTWKAGEPRTTPKGTPLEGLNRETYWYTQLCDGEMPPSPLATEVDAALQKLMPHRPFLRRLRTEGGRSELFIGWYLRTQAGETFPHSILAKLADLEIDLSFDNYYDPDLPDDDG